MNHVAEHTTSEQGHGSVRSYSIGFALSIILTLVAYFAVTHHLFNRWTVLILIVALAIVQFVVQLVFFLHLGRESKPRWNLTAFWFMLVVLVILVFASLWIMNNLNYNTMTPAQTDKNVMQDEGVKL